MSQPSDTISELTRLIAFLLPQFHPIPENDEWWGKGFTEWTNVAKARPRFPWHEQPHLPADLGFYDLRLPEARQAQADLAREYGIHGFCYYHYWFSGRRLLERPFNEVLASGKPDFPFCLCWANEPWSRRWDGSESHVLMPQNYSDVDDLEHVRWLIQAFRDPRYIRIEGKPVFLVYRTSLLPDSARTTEIWREEARRQGVGELFLCYVESFQGDKNKPPGPMGYDASVEFVPEMDFMGSLLGQDRPNRMKLRLGLKGHDYWRDNVTSYETLVRNELAKPKSDYERFRCVTPAWDNSARRAEKATILKGSTPELYREWLEGTIRQAQTRPPERRVVFVNAWNEWAEGNHLEPCQRWGRAYLEATRQALNTATS